MKTNDLGKSTNTDEELVAKWTKRFEAAQTNQAQLFDAFSRWYDNFNAVYNQKIAPMEDAKKDKRSGSAQRGRSMSACPSKV